MKLHTACWLATLALALPAAATGDEFGYRFQKGQVFAYQLEIVWETAEKTEWFSGTPVFDVKHVDEKGNAELLVVGRLRGYWQPKGGNPQAYDGREVWLGTRLVANRHGKAMFRRPDRNLHNLPYVMRLFMGPTEMLLPEAADPKEGRKGREGSTSLVETTTTTGGPIYLLPKTSYTKGLEQNWRQTTSLGGTLHNVYREQGFRTTEGASLSWSYKGNSRFDAARGLCTSLAATFETESAGVRASPVRINARLLEGEELKKAIAQGKEDWKLIPAQHLPIEAYRRHVALTRPSFVMSKSELKADLAYAFYCEENRYVLARVVAIVDDSHVRVRCVGSNEEKKVAIRSLAIVPPDQQPLAAQKGKA